jgi:hypothetical protein
MSAPSLRQLTLGELAQSEQVLEMLLAENETLFAEHKAGIAKGVGYQLAKAVGSFANTLGGWVLVGVKDGSPDPTWEPPPGGFVDAVRQRLEGQLDPLPSFAADVLPVRGHSIGVVRVYESTDTPHILLADGSVVVREPAQDAKLRKAGKYEATPIRSHYELAQLMRRGSIAEEAALARLAKGKMPFLESSLRFHSTQAANDREVFETIAGERPALILRAVPLNLSTRWREWAVSEAGVEAVGSLAQAITKTVSNQDLDVDAPVPHPTGVAVTARERRQWKWVRDGHRSFIRVGTAAVDGGGALGLRLGFKIKKNSGAVYDWRTLADDDELPALLGPLVEEMTATLTGAEQLGRFAVHLFWLGMGELFRIVPANAGEGSPPDYLPGGGTLTVDGLDDPSERDQLVRGWCDELLRASGVPVWRGP